MTAPNTLSLLVAFFLQPLGARSVFFLLSAPLVWSPAAQRVLLESPVVSGWQTHRLVGLALFAAGLLLLSVPSSAQAEASCSRREAPGLFVDLFSSTRIYPNADAA